MCALMRIDPRYRTVHFRALVVDIDGVQILPGKLPCLNASNTSKPMFQCPAITNTGDNTNGTNTTEEHVAHLCEVHQSRDTRLTAV